MLSALSWLTPAPADFRLQLKALAGQSNPGQGVEAGLVRLAGHRLSEAQLAQLARAAHAMSAPLTNLRPITLGVSGDGTLSLLTSALVGSAVRHGLLLSVVEGGFNSAIQDASDPASALRQAKLDMLLLATDRRHAGLGIAAASEAEASQRVTAALQRLKLIIDALRSNVAGPVFVQTMVPPLEPLFGSLDAVQPTSAYAMVQAFNLELAQWALTGEITLIDIARLAANVGIEHWDDPRHWHGAKLSFSPDMLPVYGDLIGRTLAASAGRSRKALVLDLDNTLWGGVIGDDGVQGLRLGNGDATGEAHLAVQTLALELRDRGVVLAVCSKNEEDVARSAFQHHPEMLLREDHIAVFIANWTDKASNLRAIAAQLNIGLDALVFLDDNPAEREQVRRELPMVAVPELPSDPASYARILAAAGYFETVAFTAEDRLRAEQYRANAQRQAALADVSDLDGYLRSLEMTLVIRPFDEISRPRIVQLINKSNQFNLTTRRYAEAEVAAMESDRGKFAISLRLVDRFGDNGLISVIIVDRRGESWEIDTWLMSCRVLGRRVEQAALSHLVAAARSAGARELIGRYRPSGKNRIVADHYKTLGFEAVDSAEDGETRWRLDLSAWSLSEELPMTVDEYAMPQQVAA